MNLEKAKKKEKAIRTLEKLGYEVTLIKENRMVYSKYEQENKYCENCSLCYTNLVNNDPRSGGINMVIKLYCRALDETCIASYEPYENTKTEKTLACPKLGREISKKEKKEAKKWLKIHQKYF